LALLYAIIVCLAAVWAWYTDVTLLHSTREHLLPNILLFMVALPSSNTFGYLYGHWPAFFTAPLVQLAWLTACGAFQAVVLYFLSKHVPKACREA